MLKNYLLITLRLIWRNKFFSSLNIIGLALGMATALIIFQYISFENSFDNFHSQSDDIFLITQTDKEKGTESPIFPPIVATELRQSFTEILASVRILQEKGAISTSDKKHVFNEYWAYTDSSFFKIFDFKILQGNKSQLLNAPNQVAISKTYAQKYFGKQNPINQKLLVNDQFGEHICLVKAVFEDMPYNSHIQFDVLLSLSSLKNNKQNWAQLDGWTWGSFYTYLKLEQNTNKEKLSENIEKVADKRGFENFRLNFIPLEKVHLKSNLSQKLYRGGNIQTILILGFVATFVLLLAWINYINLATSRAIKRAKEIGVRKVAGARKIQLIKQFLLEAFILNLLALFLAFLIADLALPFIKALIPEWNTTDFALSFKQILIIAVSFIFGTFLSGLYPAFVLSSYQPIQVLKNNFATASRKGILMRKILVILQFGISIFLLIATLGIYTQTSFMMSQNLGMNIDKILVIKSPAVITDKTWQNAEVLKEKLKKLPEITKVTMAGRVPSKGYNWGSAAFRPMWDKSDKKYRAYTYYIDNDFVDTYQLKLLAGSSGTDKVKNNINSTFILLNESALKLFGFSNPEDAIGKKLRYKYEKEMIVEIIGIVADYHHNSLKQTIEPVIFYLQKSALTLSLKLNLPKEATQNLSSFIKKIQLLYRNIFPESPFEYYFLEDVYNLQYEKEEKFVKLLGIFTLLALIIAGMGLYALAAFSTAQRTKEIGVRKVLGASMKSILFNLGWNFIRLVLIASIFALPLAYFFLQNWLENFAYQMNISVFLFLIPLLFILFFTITTIAYHILRVANSNPVKSLKYE